MRSLVIKGNSKMGKSVAVFNLPPGKTCTPTQWCLTGRSGKPACYAFRNNCILPSVIASTEWRMQESLKPDFVDRVVSELDGRFDLVRVHSTGDFYSSEYVKKWLAIATALPRVRFRTTTRRSDLAPEVSRLASLRNFVIRESLDPFRPEPGMGLPFAALSSLAIAKGKFKCPNGCETCGYVCWMSRRSICFDEH